MRKILYVVILGTMFLIPVERLDIAKLEPVEAVAIYKEGPYIVLQTDTQAKGLGTTVDTALEDLKKSTASVIYLDTAEYLLAEENIETEVLQLRQYLKARLEEGSYNYGDVKKEAEYLEAHGHSAKPEK